VDNGVHVHQFFREKEDLESLFLKITGGENRGAKNNY